MRLFYQPTGWSVNETDTRVDGLERDETIRKVLGRRLPAELVDRITALARPRMASRTKSELEGCFECGKAVVGRLDRAERRHVRAEVPAGLSLDAASVAACWLLRAAGRDVRLQGRGHTRVFYFPRRRRRVPYRADAYAADSDDEGERGLAEAKPACGFLKHLTAIFSVVLLLAPSAVVISDPPSAALRRQRARSL
mmetsp:Transcript_26696/g.80050  ORF Transcript_26696/g.80050 Transcript_26696/m.80050 type:complete len:196 (-) Transcript_26696:30-617(-)